MIETQPPTTKRPIGGAPAVVARDLAAGYSGKVVWAHADFSIAAGSFTAILGPNGGGKSTLIRMILGLLPPLHGELQVLGGRPHRGNALIGYIPQHSSFDPELSIRGRDFVNLGIDGHRWGVRLSGAASARAADAAIRAVGAGSYADRPIGRLSGGEQQRLLLAQALVGNPQVLLMDEPLSQLDVRNQSVIVHLIGELKRARELTVLLIAHDVNPLLSHIDHVLYVAQGNVAMGKPDEIITSESLTRIYSTPVEVLKDSRGRVFVVGLEEEVSHPHG
ncbi:MAG TPA: ABC transporter ATP-binding protein [Candidatus Dormibacteraeota bacterium]